ncbi:MAG TPA: hypothetical protein VGK54_12400, partial [Chloroflexota bacterium]
MHPRPESVVRITFDDGNEAELARHRVTADEVIEVFENDPLWRTNRRDRAGNRQAIGRTNGGRLLTVVAIWDVSNRVLRPITAWDASPAETTS